MTETVGWIGLGQMGHRMSRHLAAAGLETPSMRGLVYNPIADCWSLSADTDVNYMAAAARPAQQSS